MKKKVLKGLGNDNVKKKHTIAARINRIDAHHRLYAALAAAIVILLALIPAKIGMPIQLMLSWLTYVFTSLALSWTTILTSHPAEVKDEAHAQDSSRTLVFFFVIAAAFASLFAILILLQSSSHKSNTEALATVIIPLACVAGSWWLMHTVFTLRYAHFYYCDMDDDKKGRHVKPEGLIFPEEKEPDYLDFTYFAFVIGMTFQVSDVQITSKRIRRLAWMHGVLSFAFNTFIVAFTINIIAGLSQK
jgi:uncharacterized membrane protein